MSQYANLKAAIAANVYQNHNNEVTANMVKAAMNAMTDSLGAGYQYLGIATPNTAPGTPDQKVFYIAAQPGDYTNFGTGITVNDGEVAVLKWDTAWHKEVTGAATAAQVTELGQQVIYDVSANNRGATFTSLSALLSSENLSTLIPIAVRCGGMSIRFVQSSDNKYVQYRLVTNEWSTDTEDWAIADEGVYVENPEFIYVKTDAEGKILWAIKVDGGIYYGAGCPQQVKDYIEERISSLSLDEYEDIVAFLSDYLGSDTTLKTLLDSKLDAEGLDPDALGTVQAVDNPEFIQVITDAEGKIIEATRKDGKKVFYGGIEGADLDEYATEEYVDTQVAQKVSKPNSATNNNIVLFGNDGTIKDSGYNINNLPSGSEDAIKSISINGTALPKNQNNINLPNASSEDYGLMSPQDKIALGSLQPNINIVGSGITKNAASFNFLPTNSAADNNIAIASALNGGGTILVDLPGIYDISSSIILSSNTTLIFGANTFVRMRGNFYAVVNAGAYTRTYDENIKLIGLHLIANGYGVPLIDIHNLDEHNRVPAGMIIGLHGYVDFFYIKNLTVYDYVILDQEETGYGLHICTFENVVVEKVHIKGKKDGIHFSGRGSKATIKDCLSQCYDDGCTFNAVDWSTSTPEVGWLEDILVDNCYDLVHPEHQSAGFYSRFMGGAWKDWEEDMPVMMNSIVVVEENGFKKMYRVTGHMNERGFSFISHTKPTVNSFGEVQFLDEQTVTRTVGGVTETATMKIPWILYQTQEVRYDGGCQNITLRDVHLQKTRTFTIQYYIDNEWFNAIVPYAQGVSVQNNITFERVHQECDIVDLDYVKFLDITCPVKNIKIKDCYIMHKTLVSDMKVNIAGLIYPEAIFTIAGNTFTFRDSINLSIFGTGENNIPNRIRLYGNILENPNCQVNQEGTTYIEEDII